MLPGGVTESIRYFAGYLDIFEEARTARLELDGGAESLSDVDWRPDSTPALTHASTLEEFPLQGAKSFLAQGGNAGAQADLALTRFQGDADAYATLHALQAIAINAGILPAPVIPVLSTPSMTVSAVLSYDITFSEGGNGRIIEITQTNFMLDLDQMLSIDAANLQSGEQAELIGAMLGVAGESIAASVSLPSGDVHEWTGMLLEDGEARTEGEVAPQVAAGRYVNGETVDADGIDALTQLPDGPELSDRPEEEGGGARPLEDMSLDSGGNVAINHAIIADLNEASRTFAVSGDVFVNNTIAQSIVYRDADMIWHEPDADVALAAVDNTFVNDAILEREDPHFDQAAGISPKGIKVQVDIHDGDLIDAKLLFQRNVIADGDIVSQSLIEKSGLLESGGNWQVNSAKVLDWTQYDMIVVLGDYYSLNMIVQIGVLADDDIIIAKGGGDRGVSTAIAAGGNAVTNQAAIESIGAGWKATPGSFADLAARLAAGDDPGIDAWGQVAGSATGALDILMVTGDYYDINAIYQLNVVIDNDRAFQSGASAGSIASGKNHVVNDARIVDVGGMSKQFVGGQVYEDAMLMQASLAYGDDATTTVVNGDTETLASEFVAFAGMDAIVVSDDEDNPLLAGTSLGTADEFGSMMT